MPRISSPSPQSWGYLIPPWASLVWLCFPLWSHSVLLEQQVNQPAHWGNDFALQDFGKYKMWRHYSSRIFLLMSQQSHLPCIVWQTFRKSSFLFFKGVSLLHPFQLGVVQHEPGRRIWLLLVLLIGFFLAYWYFAHLAPSLQEKREESDIQKSKLLISRTKNISPLPISSKKKNYLFYLSLCHVEEKTRKTSSDISCGRVHFHTTAVSCQKCIC